MEKSLHLFAVAFGWVLFTLLGLLAFMILAEMVRRLGRAVNNLRYPSVEEHFEELPPEPRFHVGQTAFHLSGSDKLLRRRHRRSLELVPRGRFGFAMRWTRDD